MYGNPGEQRWSPSRRYDERGNYESTRLWGDDSRRVSAGSDRSERGDIDSDMRRGSGINSDRMVDERGEDASVDESDGYHDRHHGASAGRKRSLERSGGDEGVRDAPRKVMRDSFGYSPGC